MYVMNDAVHIALVHDIVAASSRADHVLLGEIEDHVLSVLRVARRVETPFALVDLKL